MCTQKVLKKESVPFPATSDRKPDWVYMKSYETDYGRIQEKNGVT